MPIPFYYSYILLSFECIHITCEIDTMTMTMIYFFIVSSGFNIFNTFINFYDQGFILNHRRPYIEYENMVDSFIDKDFPHVTSHPIFRRYISLCMTITICSNSNSDLHLHISLHKNTEIWPFVSQYHYVAKRWILLLKRHMHGFIR